MQNGEDNEAQGSICTECTPIDVDALLNSFAPEIWPSSSIAVDNGLLSYVSPSYGLQPVSTRPPDGVTVSPPT